MEHQTPNGYPMASASVAVKSTQSMTQEKEKEDMAGSVTPNDIATLSLLGGDFYARTREPYDGTVVNNNVVRNGEQMAFQHNALSNQIRSNDTNNKLEFLQTQLSDSRFELANMLNQGRIEALQQINDARAEAAKCCCETKELVLRENAATRTLMLEQQVSARDATIQQLQHAQILAAVGSGGGRGRGND